MFYVAVTPAPFWVICLLGLAAWLSVAFIRRDGFPMALPLYLLGLAQAALAGAGLYQTAVRSISQGACLTGIIGAQAAMIVGLALLGTFFALMIGARKRLLAVLSRNWAFFAALGLLQIVVVLTLLRSALLCTV